MKEVNSCFLKSVSSDEPGADLIKRSPRSIRPLLPIPETCRLQTYRKSFYMLCGNQTKKSQVTQIADEVNAKVLAVRTVEFQ